MQTKLFIFLFLSVLSVAQAQNTQRTEISGKVVVEVDDREGITVYNKSTKKGTLTDQEGKFTIAVGLHDKLEFHSLQFQDFKVEINEDILKSKKVTVFLVEQVNKLDEVVLLPYDLTGNLSVDLNSVKTFNPDMDGIYFGLANMNEYEFPDDYKSGVVNIAMPGTGNAIPYGLNLINIANLFLKPMFKLKSAAVKMDTSTQNFTDRYSEKFLVENLNIPAERVDEFLSYLQKQEIDQRLLEKGHELELLEYVNEQSKSFLAQ